MKTRLLLSNAIKLYLFIVIFSGCSDENAELKFQQACMKNDIENVKKYVEKIDINGEVSRVHFVNAILKENDAITGAMIDAGINLEFGTEHGTILMAGVLYGSTEFVKQLMDAGIDVNKKNSSGATALSLAKLTNKKEKIKLLESYGAK